jgi:hypothetical protein
MSNNMNGLFVSQDEPNAVQSTRSLAGTAELTRIASDVTKEIMQKVNADFENYRDDVELSKHEHSAMDALIKDVADLSAVDVSFINDLDEETVDGILKSQQSKRSRAKGKVMTFENYMSMMTAAVAENLVRLATGKEKHAFAGRMGSLLELTEEQIQELAADQERLRKEIRNIQSRKSIMKSKADFTTEDERWQNLVKVEDTLKSLRVNAPRVDATKEKLSNIIKDVNIDDLHAKDSKELLESIKNLIAE